MLLADVGLPMIVVIWPIAVFGLLPVILVETEVMRRLFTLRYRDAIAAATAANVTSLIVGVPLAWGAMVLIQFAIPGGGRGFYGDAPWKQAILGAAWQAPDTSNRTAWIFPVANLVLLIPLYAASSAIEGSVYRSALGKHPRAWRASWLANAASYMLFVVFWLVMLAVGMRPR